MGFSVLTWGGLVLKLWDFSDVECGGRKDSGENDHLRRVS